MFSLGDRVKKADADLATSIPAYRDLRGTVVQIFENGNVRVHWDCDSTPEWGNRLAYDLTKVENG
jgi:hypothetical protein